MKIRRFLVGVAAAMILLSGASANASHIFSTNITIEGTPIAAGDAFTDPLIIANVGDLITFRFELFGDPDTFNVTFADSGGSTLATPANASVVYPGGFTQGAPFVYTFDRTYAAPGVFDGTFVPDFPVSFPDYIFPGGAQASEPVIPFRLQVNAVPEPATLLLLCSGLALAALRSRRRN